MDVIYGRTEKGDQAAAVSAAEVLPRFVGEKLNYGKIFLEATCALHGLIHHEGNDFLYTLLQNQWSNKNMIH